MTATNNEQLDQRETTAMGETWENPLGRATRTVHEMRDDFFISPSRMPAVKPLSV